MSFRTDLPRRFIINAFKRKQEKLMHEKMRKKGVLTKILQNNQKKSNVLVDILRESDSFNTMSSFDRKQASPNDPNSTQKTTSNDDFLKKYRSTNVGGPKFSIAQTRAHHLSNFLSEYMINALSEGLFDAIEIDLPAQTLPFKPASKFSFEISNVELLCDLSAIQIYWLCSSDERVNVAVEAALNTKLCNQIRTRLIEDRVINYVPRIVFCRDTSRVLNEKLDEYLAKIELEKKFQDQNEPENDAEEKVAKEEKKEPKLVNNLYGIDVNRLMDIIRKDGSKATEWKPEEESVSLEKVQVPETSLARVSDDSNFTAKLKAFEIQKRQRAERLKKSTLARLELIEFENLRNQDKQ